MPTKEGFVTCLLLVAVAAYGQEISFHYKYDHRKELPDSPRLTNGWYLPIQQQFVDYFNQQATVKYNIDPQSLNGTFWNPSYFIRFDLIAGDLPSKTRYYVDISSEGVGFEGYAIASFLTEKNGRLSVDAAYGSFANNAEGNYAPSFYRPYGGPGKQDTSKTGENRPTIPPNIAVKNQVYTTSERNTLRNKNNLYFGLVPHELVTRSLQTGGHHILIELRGEQYQYRLVTLQNRLQDRVKNVTRDYLYGDFQQDWRFLFGLCTFRESAVFDADKDLLSFNLSSDPTPSNAQALERNLFPHLEIQQILSSRLETHRFPSKQGVSQVLVEEAIQKANTRSPSLFVVDTAYAMKKDTVDGNPRIFFDTLADNSTQPSRFKNWTFLGDQYDPVYYTGKLNQGKAEGLGYLYVRDRSRSGGKQLFELETFFHRGLPDGMFFLNTMDHWAILTGSLQNWVPYDDLYKITPTGVVESKGWYRNNDLIADSVIEYHRFDDLQFNHVMPELSVTYTTHIKGILYGMEQTHQGATKEVHQKHNPNKPYRPDDYTLYISDSAAYYQLFDCQVMVPFTRDYKTRKMVPTGKVYANYNNGSKMISNWDPTYIMGGPSLYSPYNYPGQWFPTQVSDGYWDVQIVIEKQGNSFWDKLGNVLTAPITEPIKLIGPAAKFLTGKENFKTFAGQFLSVEEKSLGDRFAFEGDIVHVLGDAGQKMLDLSWPAVKALMDYNAVFSPITSEIKLASTTAHTLGIHNPTLDNLQTFMDKLTTWRDTVYYTIWKMTFQTASVAGTVENKFGTYLALASGGFPKAIVNPVRPIPIKNPTLELRIASNYLQQMFANTFSHRIPINSDLVKGIEIKGPKIVGYDSASGALTVGFSEGNIFVQSGPVKNTFTIKGCNIEILPELNTRNNKTYLDLRGVLTYLDLKDANPIIDRMLAWAIQTEFLNKDTLGSLELTSYLNRSVYDTLEGKRIFGTDKFEKQLIKDSIALAQATWHIAGNYLSVSGVENIFDRTQMSSLNQLLLTEQATSHDLPDEIKHLNCSSWPVIKDVPVPSTIVSPDLEAVLSSQFMKKMVETLFGQTVEFPFTDDISKKESNYFISLRHINQLTLEEKNVILLDLTGDIWFRWKVLGKKASTKLTINHLNLYIVPTIVKKDTTFYLNFNTQIKTLNVDGLPVFIEKCLANFINYNGYLNNEKADITKAIKFQIESPLEKGKYITPKVSAAEILSDKTNYHLKIKIE